MAGPKKYKTLSEKWAAEDAAAAAKKKASTPAKKAPEKKPSLKDLFSGKSATERRMKEAGASVKKPKSSRRYT